MRRLSENVNVKYYNIINSRKTNQKLIENITIESQKNEDQSMLRPSENINRKQCNIIDSRKTN